MTSNERKTLETIYNQKGKATIQLIANKTKLSAEYIRLMCRWLERAGYVTFVGSGICQLSSNGQAYFESRSKEKQIEKKEGDVAVANTSELDDVKDISPEQIKNLIKAGYTSMRDLAEAPISKIMQQLRVNVKKAAHWINQARRKAGIIHEEGEGEET